MTPKSNSLFTTTSVQGKTENPNKGTYLMIFLSLYSYTHSYLGKIYVQPVTHFGLQALYIWPSVEPASISLITCLVVPHNDSAIDRVFTKGEPS